MEPDSDNIRNLNDLNGILKISFKDDIIDSLINNNELDILVQKNAIKPIVKFLRNDSNSLFTQLIDIFAVDYPEKQKRFQIIYRLLSMTHNQRLLVRVDLSDGESIESISEIFSNSNWFEREVWDMYGVLFSGHPDLRRILTDYGFEGHPQRKDFPLTGYLELRYDETEKRVVYDKVKLDQQFRNFDFLSPWEGAEHAHNQVTLPGDEKASNDG
ncbi:MAG: NADH-quinone oxidoreductase subunit C [Alphaproteobacteria bacterium TMED87]|nr:NADH-quinone oxidoreductase subunit C [Rhodospirillaceae bacterium]OUV11882.1 MAG: NADH-quinone oxidoreductase subunit C [Alphaproteobacteria bacterium TMED87]